MACAVTMPAPALDLCPQTEVHNSLEVIDELYNYTHWIFSTIRPFIRGSVCEIGCGIGAITEFLLNQERVVAIEPHPEAFRRIQHRFADHRNVSFLPCSLQQCPNEDVRSEGFDTVICLNVLEHLENDIDSLHRMRRLCRDKGQVVVLVPAHMSIYGEMDRSFGHYRRYNRRTLSRAFAQAGLEVADTFYMNAVGYFGWLWEGRIMRRRRISASRARVFDRLVPIVDAIERIIKPPFGQSLVMVGTRG
ncbi:MAG: class I SAM-dependent methyltransferase [Planctomycetes bacterium]|nr:class I SAM-dependent methyltransferase [Planctomycetota bacterium]